jgi:hypothetical protein
MDLKGLYRAYLVLIAMCFSTYMVFAQNYEVIEIDTTQGQAIKQGASGFNVRIADKVWSYTHPDFVASVKELKPGWLRYFSGTMGDAFSAATGQYDLDYIAMFDHPKPFLKGHRFVDTKGPHRLVDLYQLLGEISGKLVITVNAFSETPEMTLELARFCKNNNIKVEAWQFCNEPYFYVPNRNRYWWNNGYDYAAKMQPYAEAIKQVFPEANLALNYTWDGVWTFMKEINQFQQEHGAYWNTFSKHSYAPHTGKKETQEQAYKRANTKLIEATNPAAMEEIEAYTWKNVPMLITEFGVWNSPLNGIYSSVYNIEYVMRQLEHTNSDYIAAHEVSNKFLPLRKRNALIESAFKNKRTIDTDTILTGIHRDLEGKAFKIYNEATNSSNFIYKTNISNAPKVKGLKGKQAVGMYVQTYKGNNGFNYLVVTNRSEEALNYQVKINGKNLDASLITKYISGEDLSVRDTDIKDIVYQKGVLHIQPYSISVSKWKTNLAVLAKPTIYKTTIEKEGVLLTWGTISGAESYKIAYGVSNFDQSVFVKNKTSFLLQNLKVNARYNFRIEAVNSQNASVMSDVVSVTYKKPAKPEIFKVSRRDDTVTLFWKSVPNATGYLINYTNAIGENVEINASNVYGYRIKNLKDETKYQFSVTAYNGLGKGESSNKETVLVSSKVPFSPRNVSAIKKVSNTIQVKWHPQKNVSAGTSYNVYRGEKLHQFLVIAKGIKDTVFVDSEIERNKQYYYTVKAQTEAGESNFYPNIATTFSEEKNNKINIQVIQANENGYLVKVKLNGLKINSEDTFGVVLNNISYLNVENSQILGTHAELNTNNFNVLIPKDKVKENSNYAVKAFVINQAGKTIESAIVNQYIKKQ